MAWTAWCWLERRVPLSDNGQEDSPVVVIPSTSSVADLGPAIRALSQGQLIVFPTDTVYGIGTNPNFELSIHRLYRAKKRDRSLPLTLHAADRQQALSYVSGFSQEAEYLANLFWPGQLTLVLPRSVSVPASMVGGLGTVGIRVPDHDVVRAIAHEAGVPIAGTSANLSGSTTGTKMSHAMDDFGDVVDVYVDCGATSGGVESTVLDLTSDSPRIIRPGAISADQIRDALLAEGLIAEVEAEPPRVSKLTVHPGPRLVAVVGAPEWAAKAAYDLAVAQIDLGPVWLLFSSEIAQSVSERDLDDHEGMIVNRLVTADRLYEILREAEGRRVGQIICVGSSQTEDAILMDRAIRRASKLVTESEEGSFE